jgi:hypothetical protein
MMTINAIVTAFSDLSDKLPDFGDYGICGLFLFCYVCVTSALWTWHTVVGFNR